MLLPYRFWTLSPVAKEKSLAGLVLDHQGSSEPCVFACGRLNAVLLEPGFCSSASDTATAGFLCSAFTVVVYESTDPRGASGKVVLIHSSAWRSLQWRSASCRPFSFIKWGGMRSLWTFSWFSGSCVQTFAMIFSIHLYLFPLLDGVLLERHVSHLCSLV